MEPTDALRRALDQSERIVESIDPTQLDRPTPCTEFDVKALLNHTVASVQGLANAASGETWDMATYGHDLLGDDPVGAFKAAAAALRSATSGDDTLTREWAMPFGPTPGERAIAIGIMEVTQHGWDLAKATAPAPAFDEDLAAAALEVAKANMPPDDQRPAETFGPSVPVADDAPASDRLAAFLGRTP
jgi:uncharacterized protein (TIGR03086 family)